MGQAKTILFDINHPADFHFFKNSFHILSEQGFTIHLTARNKDCTYALLRSSGMAFVPKGKGYGNLLGKLFYALKSLHIIFYYSIKIKPNVMVSFGSPYIAIIGWLLKIKVITFDDTNHNKLLHSIYPRFSTQIFTPECFPKNFGSKQMSFDGYKELAYLHPRYFQANKNIVAQYHIPESFIFVRFVSSGATHDYLMPKLSLHQKIAMIQQLNQIFPVVISSEEPLPEVLQPFQIHINPQDIHSITAQARVYVGESATMAAESAVLGVPAVYIDASSRCYTDELSAKYGLVYCYQPSQWRDAVAKVNDVIQSDIAKYQHKAQMIVKDKIDVTAFIVQQISKM